jgi:hypothetical protein
MRLARSLEPVDLGQLYGWLSPLVHARHLRALAISPVFYGAYWRKIRPDPVAEVFKGVRVLSGEHHHETTVRD